MQFTGNIFNCLGVASLAGIEGKALGVERIIRKELQLLLLHLAEASTDADYDHGVAIFTLSKSGLMFEATAGGQKFNFKPK